MPANTTRHYWATARLLATQAERLHQTAWLTDDQADMIHRMYVDAFSVMFAADNPRFKGDLFVKAALELVGN